MADDTKTKPQDMKVTTEDDFGKFLFALFDDARKEQYGLVDKWRKWDRRYRGKQWDKTMESWRAQITVNHIRRIVQTILSITANVDPRITVMGVEGGDRPTADALDEIFKYNANKYEWGNGFDLAFLSKLKFGTVIHAVGWDEDKGLEGDVVVRTVQPFNFIIDPTATSIEEARYIFEAQVLTLAEIKKRWPKNGDKVRANYGFKDELKTMGGANDPSDMVDIPDYNRDDLNYDTGDRDYPSAAFKDELDRALVVTAWLRDTTTSSEDEEYEEETEGVDDEGNTVYAYETKKRKVKKEAYPGGRRVIFSGTVILSDEANPYAHRQFPYVEEHCYPDDLGFWGTGVIEDLETLQYEANKRKSQIADNCNLMGNPTWILDSHSGVDPKKISNAPGKAIRKTQGSEVRRDTPPELPRYIIDSYETTRRDMQDISGVSDVLQGQFAHSMDNFSAMRAAMDAAEQPIQKMIRNQLLALRRVGRLACACYMQFYTEERWRRIVDSEKVDEMIASRPGGFDFPLEEIYEMYNLTTETEIMTRTTRDLLREDLKTLIGLGAPQLVASLIEMYPIPNKAEIIATLPPGLGGPQPPVNALQETTPPAPNSGEPPPALPPPSPSMAEEVPLDIGAFAQGGAPF